MRKTIGTSKDSQPQQLNHGLPRRLNVMSSLRFRLKVTVDRTKPLIRVVYVDAVQVDAVARELESTVAAMTREHASGQVLTDHRVLFFGWNVLRGQERLGAISDQKWWRAFIGGAEQIQTRLGEILE
jgi:hypothetical protein